MLNKFLFIFFLFFWFTSPAFAANQIVVVKISGAINPAVAEFVSHEIHKANEDQQELIVLNMDTPGGLDTSMRQIIKKIQSSEVPVATYVSPSGSRAASEPSLQSPHILLPWHRELILVQRIQ